MPFLHQKPNTIVIFATVILWKISLWHKALHFYIVHSTINFSAFVRGMIWKSAAMKPCQFNSSLNLPCKYPPLAYSIKQGFLNQCHPILCTLVLILTDNSVLSKYTCTHFPPILVSISSFQPVREYWVLRVTCSIPTERLIMAFHNEINVSFKFTTNCIQRENGERQDLIPLRKKFKKLCLNV